MAKLLTLKENREFKKIYNRGKYFVSPELVTYVMKNKTGKLRYGITVSKKIGNAVTRNRTKRIIRASLYMQLEKISCPCDIVFVARVRTSTLKSTDLSRIMEQHFKSAGIIDQT